MIACTRTVIRQTVPARDGRNQPRRFVPRVSRRRVRQVRLRRELCQPLLHPAKVLLEQELAKQTTLKRDNPLVIFDMMQARYDGGESLSTRNDSSDHDEALNNANCAWTTLRS
jgi:hypothetical protein